MNADPAPSRRFPALAAVTILLCAAGMCLPAGRTASAASPVPAATEPSRDITLMFVNPGWIGEILVREGDAVEAGQVLLRQDDTAEQAQLAILKAKAENTVRVDAARAQLEQKKVDYERTATAGERGAASPQEVEHARLDVEIARLSLELAKFESLQARREYEESRIRVEQMRLKSPIDGTVEQVFAKRVGANDRLEPMVRVVALDPLHTEVAVDTAAAAALPVGGKMTVRFPDGTRRTGRIVHVAGVAVAGSATRTVRLEIDNPDGRPAGENVEVFLPGEAPEEDRNDAETAP
jgi:RND family efflux transporter MFP subunit